MFSRRRPEENITQILMYIFPMQFGLHNVFTSEVDNRETVQPFKDYTLREEEIDSKYPDAKAIKTPKRLRGKARDLVKKFQILHSRCSYNSLLEYYCPVSLRIGILRLLLTFAESEESRWQRRGHEGKVFF